MKNRKWVLSLSVMYCVTQFMPSEARVVRIDNSGKVGDYDVKQGELNQLCEALASYLQSFKTARKIPDDIIIGNKRYNIQNVAKKIKDVIYNGVSLSKDGFSQMPGFAIYENGDDIRVYVADKETVTARTKHVNNPRFEFTEYSHTERQLIIAAIKDVTQKKFKSDGDEIKGDESILGHLYVYTHAKPCATEGKPNDSDGISCLTFYAKIAKMYNKMQGKKQSDLKIHILFSDKQGPAYSDKNSTQAEISNMLKETNTSKGKEYEVAGTNIYVKRI